MADADERISHLEAEVETMLGIQAGLIVIVTSLLAKHPDYEQLQLHLTTVLEVADVGAGWRPLTEKQRAVARGVVEHLQQIREVRGEIRPLG